MTNASAILAILFAPQRHIVSPDIQSILLLLLAFIFVGFLAAYFRYSPPKWRGGERLTGFIVGVPVAVFGICLLGEISLQAIDKISPAPEDYWIVESLSQILTSWIQPTLALIAGLLIGGVIGTQVFRRRCKNQ